MSSKIDGPITQLTNLHFESRFFRKPQWNNKKLFELKSELRNSSVTVDAQCFSVDLIVQLFTELAIDPANCRVSIDVTKIKSEELSRKIVKATGSIPKMHALANKVILFCSNRTTIEDLSVPLLGIVAAYSTLDTTEALATLIPENKATSYWQQALIGKEDQIAQTLLANHANRERYVFYTYFKIHKKSVQFFSLSNRYITARFLELLHEQYPNLQEIHFQNSTLEPLCFRALKKFTQLQKIDFSKSQNVTNNALQELAEVPQLFSVILNECTSFDDIGLQSLLAKRFTLNHLSLMSCPQLKDSRIYVAYTLC